MLALGPDIVQTWAGAWAAVCAAIMGTGVLAAAIYINLPKGKAHFGSWVHDISGANGVASTLGSKLDDAISSINGLREDLQGTNAELTALASVQASNHEANQARAALHDTEIDRIAQAQDRSATAIKALADEQTAESEQRTTALAALGAQVERIAVVSDHAMSTVAAHEKAKGKHVSKRKAATA